MFDAILFDLDGTLIDTNELIIESFMHTFSVLGKTPPSRNEIIDCFGEYLVNTMEKFFGNENIVEDAVKIYREFNLKNHDSRVSTCKNAHELLKILKNRGYNLGVVTSKSRNPALKGMMYLDLMKYFDVLIAGDDVEKHKPDSEPILKACNLLNVLPDKCVMVGDSVYDIESGKNAGSTTCGVLYSFMRNKLLRANADYYISDLMEILDLIKG